MVKRSKLYGSIALMVLIVALQVVLPPFAVTQGRYGGTLIVAQGTDAETLDPHSIRATPAANITDHMCETLVALDENNQVVPHLAISWTVSSDGLIWTFRLREGVKFHDGTPFNAEAVKFNIERLLDPKTLVPLRTYIAMVKSVEVVDDHTVKFILKYPHAPFLHRLTASVNAMVSPTAVKSLGKDFPQHPVGTGPFKFVEWIRGDRAVLERNENYWGKRPYLDKIIFKPVPEDATRVMMLEAGTVDVIVRVPPHDVPRLSKNLNLSIIKAPSTRVIYIGMNTQWGPLKDVRVRQAINYAVDKGEIVKTILSGAGRPSDSPLIPAMFGYHSVRGYEYNPGKAKELLKEAGYPVGFEVTLRSPHGRYLMDIKVTEAVQTYLQAVGINAKIVTMEWATYLAFLSKPLEETGVQMYLLGWGPWILDGDQMLYPMFHSSQWPPKGLAAIFYRNPKVDEILDIGTSTVDPDIRLRVYREAQEFIVRDAPWLFLHSEEQLLGVKKNVKGVLALPTEYLRVGYAWFE